MSRFPSLEVLPSQNLWTLAPCLDFRTSVSPLVAVAPTELSDVWKSQINDQRAVQLRDAHARVPGKQAWPAAGMAWQRAHTRVASGGSHRSGCGQVSRCSAWESICIGALLGLG